MKLWGSTLITNAIITGASLFSGVLVARFLGVEDRGLLAAVIYWPHFVSGIASLGINEAVTISTARFGATNTLKATVFYASLALSLPIGFIGYFLMPALLGEFRQDYIQFSQLYFLAFLPATFLAMNLLAIEQGEFNFRSFNFQRIIQAIAHPLLLVTFWLNGILSVKNAAIAVFSGTLIVALLRMWHSGKELLNYPSLTEATRLFSSGIKLHMVNIAKHLSTQIDKMMLIFLANNTELGLYVVATTASMAIMSLFLKTYINIMLPSGAKFGLAQENIKQILNSLYLLIGILILITIFLVFFIPYLITLVYGDGFSSAGMYAQILVGASFLIGVKSALVYLMRSWGINKPAIIGESLTAFILLAGSFFVIQNWSTLGLCFLVLLAHAVGLVYLSFFFLKEIKFSLSDY